MLYFATNIKIHSQKKHNINVPKAQLFNRIVKVLR